MNKISPGYIIGKVILVFYAFMTLLVLPALGYFATFMIGFSVALFIFPFVLKYLIKTIFGKDKSKTHLKKLLISISIFILGIGTWLSTADNYEPHVEKLKAEQEAYDQEQDELWLAEQAEKMAQLEEQKQAEEEAAAKEAEYYSQFDWYNNDFGVKIDRAYTDSIGTAWVEGRLMPFNKDYSYVQVDIELQNSNGSKVGTALANVSGLAEGQTWQFKAMGLPSGSVAGYSAISVAGY